MTHSSDRQAWLAERRRYLTSSDVAAVMGHSKFATRGTVVLDKLGLADEWEGSEQTDLGLDLEPAIAAAAKRRWGWDMRHHGELIADAHCPDLAATPDYVMSTPWGMAAVQIKLTTCRAQEDIKPKKGGEPSDAAYANGAPLYHQLQQLAELACLGYEWSTLLVLHACAPSFKLRCYPLRRRENIITMIRAEATKLMTEVRTQLAMGETT